jgi:DNA-binding NarL/FixJ family response regulator
VVIVRDRLGLPSHPRVLRALARRASLTAREPGDNEVGTCAAGKRALLLTGPPEGSDRFARPGPRVAYARLVATRVVLADDSLIVREGLERLLATSEEVAVVDSCGDGDSLRASIRKHDPDVVITDIRMPPSNTDEGIQLAAELRETAPKIGVIVLSQYTQAAYVMSLFESGSSGRAYLLKDRVHDRQELVRAITAVAAGGSVIDPKVVDVLVEARARAHRSPLTELTARELEVLRAIAEGKSNAAIAEELTLTKHAVEKHINSIFLKVGLASSPTADSVSKRVKATLLFLAESDVPAGDA